MKQDTPDSKTYSRILAEPAADITKTQQPDQPPSTPATAEAPAVILMSATPADLSQFDDAGIHQFLLTNPTIKNIVAANTKNELEVESSKLKTELEGGLRRLESRHSLWSRRSWSAEVKVEDGAGVNIEGRGGSREDGGNLGYGQKSSD
ncbi:hypothetical protein FALBO_4151 [Fusarium albosuccineum]|uniref:Uncharacterized protein n=1 Tax=Fusarium albosuccineum TaxID=1237068 RepID=A0A8H4LJC3_9HYPO|nr:hypothetical protein FALBO_4151 [Fusarium albosuccineum]